MVHDNGSEKDVRELLRPYRLKIDEIDNQIIDLLVERFGVVRQVGHLKTAENIKIVQSKRVIEVVERNAQRAQEKGFDPDVVREIYTLLIDHAHNLEDAIKETEQGE